jgi:hypothetical protein
MKTSTPPTSNLTRDHLFPLLQFLALTIVITWPLLPNLLRAAPSRPGEAAQDLWEKLWNLWWFNEALQRGTNPFQTDMLFAPLGASLLFHPLSPANALMTLPLQSLGGPLLAYNVVVLLSFVLSAYAIMLLVRQNGGSTHAGMLGGLIYSFSAFHIFHISLSHLELFSIQWLPFYVLALNRALDPQLRQRWLRWSLLIALLMVVLFFTSLYLTLYTTIISLIWVVWRVIERINAGQMHHLGPILGRIALAGVLVVLVVGPIQLLPMFRELQGNSAVVQQIDTVSARASDPLDVLLPPADYLPRALLNLPEASSGGAFLGYLPLLLALIAISSGFVVHARWLVLGLLGWLISLGPLFPLYELIFSLPGLQISRYPDRFILLSVLSVSVLAAHGIDQLLEWWPQRLLRIAVGMLIMIELFPNLRMTPVIEPPFYRQIAQTSTSGSLLELPIGRLNREWVDMYAQTLHRRPILDGALARPVPSIPIEWMPLIKALETPEAPPDIVEEQAETRAAAIRYVDLQTLIYHRQTSTARVTPPTAAALSQAAGVAVREVYSDNQVVVYQLDPGVGPAVLEPFLGLGNGWDGLEQGGGYRWRWFQPDGGELLIYAPTAGQYRLQLTMLAYGQPRLVEVWHGDTRLTEVPVEVGLTEATVALELAPGRHSLRLVAPAAGTSPRELGQGPDPRPLRVAVYAARIVR